MPGEASCATGVTRGSGVPFLPAWRHSRDRNDVTSWRSGPARCHIVAVGGAVTGVAGSRREGPPGPAWREGCARSRRPAAQHSPPGSRAAPSRKPGSGHGRGTPAPHHTSREPQAPHIFAATRAEPRPPSRDWGLWHLTPLDGVGGHGPRRIERAEVCVPVLAKSGDWAERVGDHALAQPRAAAPGALTCSGIESRRGAAWAVHPASVDVTRSAAAAQALAELLRLLWPSRSCSACCGPRGHAGCRASFVKRCA
jgi:hypothetical protein